MVKVIAPLLCVVSLFAQQPIVIINQSSNTLPVFTLRALQSQISNDFGPAWGKYATLRLLEHGGWANPGEWVVTISDDTDLTGYSGYHSIDWYGTPYARVFSRTAQKYGKSVTVVLSHEIMEMLANPWANTYVLQPNIDGTGSLYLQEVCDPVAANTYWINAIEVSDFVTPAWFLPWPSSGPFDHLRLAQRYSTLPGGNTTVKKISGLPHV